MKGNFARVGLCSGTRSVDLGSYSSIEIVWAEPATAMNERAIRRFRCMRRGADRGTRGANGFFVTESAEASNDVLGQGGPNFFAAGAPRLADFVDFRQNLSRGAADSGN